MLDVEQPVEIEFQTKKEITDHINKGRGRDEKYKEILSYHSWDDKSHKGKIFLANEAFTGDHDFRYNVERLALGHKVTLAEIIAHEYTHYSDYFYYNDMIWMRFIRFREHRAIMGANRYRYWKGLKQKWYPSY